MKLVPAWMARGVRALSSSLSSAVRKDAVGVTNVPVGPVGSGWWGGRILESFSGAWQKNIVVDNVHDISAFSGVYACISLITNDISKLRPMLMEEAAGGVTVEVTRTQPHVPVLNKPNKYQTRIQFYGMWMTSKLLYGNTFVLKQRDLRGVVVAMHILDPRLVKPLITTLGDVYYQLGRDLLAGNEIPSTVPASEIIHDRGVCLWHPLVGVSPIYACGAAATQGNRIQANSAKFFENMSRPSGMLTAPDLISDETAERLKRTFDASFGGLNIGKLFVAGEGIEYKPLTMPASDAQLIEQLKWTVVDCARCFHVPLYKIGAEPVPTRQTGSEQNDAYYAETLQIHLESIEVLLEEGLSLPSQYSIEFDLTGLLRMDETGTADVLSKEVGAGIMTPNEARARLNLQPKAGGDTPYLQQQYWSLAQLDARPAAPSGAPAPAATAPAPDTGAAKALDAAVTALEVAGRDLRDALDPASARAKQIDATLRSLATIVERVPGRLEELERLIPALRKSRQ